MPTPELTLRLIVRTPRQTVVELDAWSLRVPTESGQVGLRPRSESALLAVEPGLVLVRTRTTTSFVATAGGLLRCSHRLAVLLTPVAVAGDDAERVRALLDAELAGPNADLQLRRAISHLEAGIVSELRHRPGAAPVQPQAVR